MRHRDESAIAAWLRKRGKAKRPSLNRRVRCDLALCFSLIDEDHSGAIDTEELRIAFAALGVEMTHEQCVSEVARVDRDGSGTVEFPEFVTLVSSLDSAQGCGNRLRSAFLAVDDLNYPHALLDGFGVGPSGEGMNTALATIRTKHKQSMKDTMNRKSQRDDARTKQKAVPELGPLSFASWSENARRSQKINLATHFEVGNTSSDSKDVDPHNPPKMPFTLTSIQFKRRTTMARVYDVERRVRMLTRDDEKKTKLANLEAGRKKKELAEQRRTGTFIGTGMTDSHTVNSDTLTTDTEPDAHSASSVDTHPIQPIPTPATPKDVLADARLAAFELKSREASEREVAKVEKKSAKFLRYDGNKDFSKADFKDIAAYLIKLKRETRRFSMAFEDGAARTTLDEKGFPFAKAKGVGGEGRGEEWSTSKNERSARYENSGATLLESELVPATKLDSGPLGVSLLEEASGDAEGVLGDTAEGRDVSRGEDAWMGNHDESRSLVLPIDSKVQTTSRRKAGKKKDSVRAPARAAAMRSAIARGFFYETKTKELKPFVTVFTGGPAGNEKSAAAAANDALGSKQPDWSYVDSCRSRDVGAIARHAVRAAAQGRERRGGGRNSERL